MKVARRKAAHAQRGKAENAHHALVLLTAEHNEIDKLAREFERARKTLKLVEKGKAALRLCHALERYVTIKDEVFYPAANAVLGDEDKELLRKTTLEHDALHDLIERIESTPAVDPSFDSTVAVLSEQAGQLMKQEEEALFPLLRHSHLDLLGTGERMAARMAELDTAPIDCERIRQPAKSWPAASSQPLLSRSVALS